MKRIFSKWLCALIPLGIVAAGALFPSTMSASAAESEPTVSTAQTAATEVATGTTSLSGTWITTDSNSSCYVYADGSYAVGMQQIDGVFLLLPRKTAKL